MFGIKMKTGRFRKAQRRIKIIMILSEAIKNCKGIESDSIHYKRAQADLKVFIIKKNHLMEMATGYARHNFLKRLEIKRQFVEVANGHTQPKPQSDKRVMEILKV